MGYRNTALLRNWIPPGFPYLFVLIAQKLVRGLAEESDVTIISEVSFTISAAIEIRVFTSMMFI